MKEIIKRMIYGAKYSSETYVRHLNQIGAKVAGSVYFVVPSKTTVDETRPYLIEIGENVTITEGVTILTHGFDWSVLKTIYGDVLGSAEKVTIKGNCFIGVNSTILKGCTIGENVIIGAGSVVTRDIPANCVAAGNPCKVICSLEQYYEKRKCQQQEEAMELIRNYYARHKEFPPASELAEFFWLFSDRNNEITEESFLRKMQYGEKKRAVERFHNTKPLFSSYAELCKESINGEY